MNVNDITLDWPSGLYQKEAGRNRLADLSSAAEQFQNGGQGGSERETDQRSSLKCSNIKVKA